MNASKVIASVLLGIAVVGATGAARADHDQYRSILTATVFIANRAPSPDADSPMGKLGWGSGALVDMENRLVITNQHVVRDSDVVLVFFSGNDEDGNLVTDARAYDQNLNTRFAFKAEFNRALENYVVANKKAPSDEVKNRAYANVVRKYKWLTRPDAQDATFDELRNAGVATMGRVVARWKEKDLAILQLDSLPEDAHAIPLAAESLQAGDSVHSIGNSGVLDYSLWRYTRGMVRNVYFHPEDKIHYLEVDSPINHGDSGGPVANDKGELVGIVKRGFDGDLVNGVIDLQEVRSLLDWFYGPQPNGLSDNGIDITARAMTR